MKINLRKYFVSSCLIAYGSDRYGVESIKVNKAQVSDDHKKVRLSLENLEPGFIFDLHIKNSLSEEGDILAHNRLFYTLNYLKN